MQKKEFQDTIAQLATSEFAHVFEITLCLGIFLVAGFPKSGAGAVTCIACVCRTECICCSCSCTESFVVA